MVRDSRIYRKNTRDREAERASVSSLEIEVYRKDRAKTASDKVCGVMFLDAPRATETA